jgi:Tol biopolymer transport system component
VADRARIYDEPPGACGDSVGTGGQIAFQSYRDGNAEIYVMDTDGSNPRNLSNHSANDWSPAWSPDGQQIAFDSNRDGNIEIYVMDANGGNPRRLTNTSAFDGYPAWLPDGTQITFF